MNNSTLYLNIPLDIGNANIFKVHVPVFLSLMNLCKMLTAYIFSNSVILEDAFKVVRYKAHL